MRDRSSWRRLVPFSIELHMGPDDIFEWVIPKMKQHYQGPYLFDAMGYDSVVVERIQLGKYDFIRPPPQTTTPVALTSAIKVEFFKDKPLGGPVWEPGQELVIRFRSLSSASLLLHACWWAEPELGAFGGSR